MKCEFDYELTPETTSIPVLRSSFSVPFAGTNHRVHSRNILRSIRNRSSIEDLSLINKLVTNFRLSLRQGTILKQRYSQVNLNNTNNNIQNTEQPQLICEERQDNAIFKIYLKRLRQKPPMSIGSSSDFQRLVDDRDEQNESKNNEHSALLYSTVKIYQLKAGTLEKIIECLTNKYGDLDTTHMLILFTTYRIYTDTRTLIDTILSRYQTVAPASLDMTEDVRKKTLKSLSTALICLLTAYKEDFYEPPCYITLKYLLEQVTDRDVHSQCKSLLNRFLKEENTPQSNSIEQDIDNNNNSKTLLTDDLYNQKRFEYSTPKHFLDMSNVLIAEQLTLVDAELLKCVLPHECLTTRGNNSKRRGINPNQTSSTLDKTVDHFNAVVHRVVSTILTEMNEQTRVRILEKWIDITYECRQLKNFSSLTAILNGLLSGCIFRLTKTWSQINIQHRTILNGLKNIFGSSADRKQARAILNKEGTAKYVDVTVKMNGTFDKKLSSKKIRDQRQMMIGTVPYLGLYLSDLTYIDSANDSYIYLNENDKSSLKLINFEKYRKQFEILAQIKLFQSAANAYTTLQPSSDFKNWFDNVQIFTDAESWDLSYRIEAKSNDNVDKQQKLQEDPSLIYRKRPLKAFPSEISLEAYMTPPNQNRDKKPAAGGSLRSSPSLSSYDKISLTSNNSFPQRQLSTESAGKKKTHSRSSSASSFLTKDTASQGYISAQASPANSLVNCNFNPVENDTLIAKVRLIGRDDLLYKKIRIGNNERASNLLKTILDKFCIDPCLHEDYCIEQQLPSRRVLLLDHYNVFYALVRQSDDDQVELIVRKKIAQEREQTKIRSCLPTSHIRTPSGLSISSTHSR